ncbi:hypothetical protein BP6252_13793 [Coleophoma cylindrospora]|uniref:Transcription factor domain-containing protein n=1 Tax=Coleophoma cylindrospora TaxID=1849047 RepID=A0A3D8Q6H4_9HELO|nr:hypothetical protein BP6252_13793 [Coleophoma cylindrospora]
MAEKYPPECQSTASVSSQRNFEFITVSGPQLKADPETQKRVRSHAQTDYRRRNPYPRHQISVQLDTALLERPTQTSSLCGSEHLMTPGPITLLDASRSDPFSTFNIDRSSRSRRLWDHVYDGSCAKFRTLIEIGFIDLARETIAISQMLSASAWHLVHHLRCEQDPADDDAKYTMIAAHSLQQKLNNAATNTTDEVIITVLASAAYANLIKDPQLFRIHMDGLSQILRERARLCNLEFSSVLRIALFWIEVNGCFRADGKPQFPQPYSLLAARSQLKFPASDISQLSSNEAFEAVEDSPAVLYVRKMLRNLNAIIDAELLVQDLWSNVLFSVFHLTPILHDIFSMAHGSVHDAILIRQRECFRLAAILYISNIRGRFDFEPGSGMLYGSKLQMMLNSPGMMPSWGRSNVSCIWILTVAACSECLFDDLRNYFLARLLECVRVAGISSFQDFLVTIIEFGWCEGAFGQILYSLGSQMQFDQ